MNYRGSRSEWRTASPVLRSDLVRQMSKIKAGDLTARSPAYDFLLVSFLALLRATFRTELWVAFNLRAAFRTELLFLDRLAAFGTEFGVRRDAGAAIRARANDGLLEFIFGHVRGFLRDLPRLLHGRFGLRRRVFCFQIGRAI